MPRRLRFAPPGYWLHLTQRGNNKQPVFTADQDRHHFLTLVGTLSEERQVRVAAYTLMTNHFHLLAVGDRSDAISVFMILAVCLALTGSDPRRPLLGSPQR